MNNKSLINSWEKILENSLSTKELYKKFVEIKILISIMTIRLQRQ